VGRFDQQYVAVAAYAAAAADAAKKAGLWSEAAEVAASRMPHDEPAIAIIHQEGRLGLRTRPESAREQGIVKQSGSWRPMMEIWIISSSLRGGLGPGEACENSSQPHATRHHRSSTEGHGMVRIDSVNQYSKINGLAARKICDLHRLLLYIIFFLIWKRLGLCDS
jgi:hypothetical protein